MNYFSDALTIGIVLVLLFGSIALYLYTRIQQTEQKNSLLESILLDLKMNAEIKSYSDLPADEDVNEPYQNTVVSVPAVVSSKEHVVHINEPIIEDITEDNTDTDQYSSVIAAAVNSTADSSLDAIVEELPSEDVHITKMNELDGYDGMKLKELQDIAKTRGIIGASTLKKAALIDALRSSDRMTTSLKSGSSAVSSLMDHSEVLTFE